MRLRLAVQVNDHITKLRSDEMISSLPLAKGFLSQRCCWSTLGVLCGFYVCINRVYCSNFRLPVASMNIISNVFLIGRLLEDFFFLLSDLLKIG